MSKKYFVVGLYVVLLASGIVVCRGRTIPLYPPHSAAHSATELLPPSAHTATHSAPAAHKRSHSRQHQVA